MEKSNIKVLKPHLNEIIELGAEIKKAVEDKRISFREAINIAIEARDLTSLVKERDAIKGAVQTLTEEEGIELAAQLNATLLQKGITKSNAHQLISETIAVWSAVDNWIKAFDDLRK